MIEPYNKDTSAKDIIHRDQVHGDVQYDRLSVALLNTKALQRLGRVYQLGYSHLVFRGGTHTRLSHVMGAAHMAGKIVDALRINYKQNRAARPKQHVAEPPDFLPCRGGSINDQWDVLRHLVTWAALLHDLGHVPLGHTLEDEFEGIFKKHDDLASPRSLHLWDRKREIYNVLVDSSLYPATFMTCKIDPIQVWQTVMLTCYFKDVPDELKDECSNFADYLSYSITSAASKLRKNNKEFTALKTKMVAPESIQQKNDLEIHRKVARLLLDATRQTKDLFRPFMTDIVANTIWADYLDYVRRDPLNVGLDVLRDDRILSHFYVSSDAAGLRMALALLDRHGKPRLDVCTGVVEQVRQRYRFAESIYYHKTKVSASAMFAKAMILIGKPQETGKEQTVLLDKARDIEAIARGLVRRPENFPEFRDGCLPSTLMHPEIGDDSLHLFLIHRAVDNIERLIGPKKTSSAGSDREKGGRISDIQSQLRGIALLQAIVRRRLYKVGFSVNATQFGRLTKGASQDSVVEIRLISALTRLRQDKALRDRVERGLSHAAGWPLDSILLYVPPRKNQAKGIETFAFDESGVVRLNEHRAVSEKVNELGKDYRDLWRILILVHPSYQNNVIELSEAADSLITELWSDFSNELVEVDLHDDQRVSVIREIAWFPYIRKDHRGAAEELRYLSIGLPGGMRVDWELFERVPILTTDSEETLTSTQYAERAFLIQLLISKHGMSEHEAIGRIRTLAPQAKNIIAPSNRRSVEIKLEALLSGGRSYSQAQEADLLRALELQQVAEDMSADVKQQKTPRKTVRRRPIERRRKRTYDAISPIGRRSKAAP